MKKLASQLLTVACLSAVAFGFTSVSPTAARADWFSCTPTEVIELGNRIHVRCANTVTFGSDVIRFIAISKSNASQAERFISFANAAYLSGKSFRVDIPRSGSGNTSGCLASDCRTPTAFGVM